MAPRNRRSKVGLTRMHAALDAMRPLGFSSDTVRKCVRDLLKVYGNDGWAFIEDAAYKVLIDTMLELPEEPLALLEHVPEPQPEGNANDSHKQLVSGPEPCKEVVMGEEEACPVNCSKLQTLDEEIDTKEEEEHSENLDAAVAPELLKDASAQSQVEAYTVFAPACTPQAKETAPKNHTTRKPCYGWISDDDEEDDDADLLQLNSAN